MGGLRIAVTGGPGGGKTTVWHELARAHPERIVAVPEVATLMFVHVFPAVQSDRERIAVQRAIFAVQHNLEAAYESRLREGQVLLCDRGTPDGGGYWPDGHEAFFREMGTSHEAELQRYDAVLFLETAACAGLSISEGNAVRLEDQATAVAIDRRLHDVWSAHPSFAHVPCQPAFETKVALGSDVLARFLDELSA
jgi:predicted ATPase